MNQVLSGPYTNYGTVVSKKELAEMAMMPNWVLLKPTQTFLDAVEQTESGLLVSWPHKPGSWKRPDQHAIMRAQVVRACDRLQYSETLRLIANGIAVARPEVDVEVDVQPGDYVLCRYGAIQDAIDRSTIIVDETGEWFYVFVCYDSLVLRERGNTITPLNGYYIVEPQKEILSTTVVTYSSKEPIERVKILAVPNYTVKRYWWEEVHNRRTPSGGYKPTWDAGGKTEDGAIVHPKITGWTLKGGSGSAGNYGYRDHGFFSVGMTAYVKKGAAPALDNDINMADRKHRLQGLRRISEKDIVAWRDGNIIRPNKNRVKVVPGPGDDYWDRQKHLQIPASFRSLPRGGTVIEIMPTEDVGLSHLMGRFVHFMGKKRPTEPELIFKENGKTLFIYNVNALV